MTRETDQALALAGVFQAAHSTRQLAQSGQVDARILECLIRSLLVRNPANTLEVYGGQPLVLHEGLQSLQRTLQGGQPERDELRYAISLLTLQRKLAQRTEMQAVIGKRLETLEHQVNHFGASHENVIESCASIYQDTISTFRQRIQVQGDMRYLQQPGVAARIRTLLLAGIRSAHLWQQLGGRRWHLLLRRRNMERAVHTLLENHDSTT